MNLEHRLKTLCALPAETEWVEFKTNNQDPDMIGQRVSALANSAAQLGNHDLFRLPDSSAETNRCRDPRRVQPTLREINKQGDIWQ